MTRFAAGEGLGPVPVSPGTRSLPPAQSYGLTLKALEKAHNPRPNRSERGTTEAPACHLHEPSGLRSRATTMGERWRPIPTSPRPRAFGSLVPAAGADIVRAARPVRVILFGSVARGDEGPDSDLDFLVVLDEFEPGRHRRRRSTSLAWSVPRRAERRGPARRRPRPCSAHRLLSCAPRRREGPQSVSHRSWRAAAQGPRSVRAPRPTPAHLRSRFSHRGRPHRTLTRPGGRVQLTAATPHSAT